MPEHIELRGLRMNGLNGFYILHTAKMLQVNEWPIYVQLATAGQMMYKTPLGWALAQKEYLANFQNGDVSGWVCSEKGIWKENIQGRWETAPDFYIRSEVGYRLYSPLEHDLERHATDRFVASLVMAGITVSGPQGVPDLNKNATVTCTMIFKDVEGVAVGSIWGGKYHVYRETRQISF